MSNEPKLNVTIAQRELRELADRLDGTANIAGNAGMLVGTSDRAGIEHHMQLAVKRAEAVARDMQTFVDRLKLVKQWTS